MRLVSLLVVILALVAPVGAEPLQPDEEVARREYAAGVDAYDHNDYDAALKRFAAAKEARPLPAFDYNIARCLDRLGRWHEAADAYDRFLAATPTAENGAELRARVIELRRRHVDEPAPIMPPSPEVIVRPRAELDRSHRPLRIGAGVVLGGAVLLGAAGAVVYGTAYHDYAQRKDACNERCDPATTKGLRDEVHNRTIGAGVLWGLAGAALVADIALWALDAKHARRLQAHLDGASVRF